VLTHFSSRYDYPTTDDSTTTGSGSDKGESKRNNRRDDMKTIGDLIAEARGAAPSLANNVTGVIAAADFMTLDSPTPNSPFTVGTVWDNNELEPITATPLVVACGGSITAATATATTSTISSTTLATPATATTDNKCTDATSSANDMGAPSKRSQKKEEKIAQKKAAKAEAQRNATATTSSST
jgi:hypothetical protein